MKEQKLASEN